MMEFFTALAEQSFLQSAMIAGVLASIACGLIGSYVVVMRISYLAGGIAHSVMGGMGIAYFLGGSPLVGALIAAVVSALIIGLVKLYWQAREDTLIGALWASGMALGIIFISQTPGYQVDLMSYLFGNILLVAEGDLWLMAGMDLIIVGAIALLYRPFQAVAFDPEFARMRGLPVNLLYLLLLCIVALTVVLLIQVVGLILVIALLTLPAAIAGHYVRTLSSLMALATLLGLCFTSAGLAISYGPDLPAGATIILLAAGCFIISSVLSARKKPMKSPDTRT
ncbi:metal ABC transporter permease [Oceanospirillum sediminis]|uniref:Metal ABC transporter permease n=1 Tax=Oceanospirillum sediminis TaxID=2760088 RepID=A0A839IUT2_9GAMM|nr:metal ABC transporter permease [Oceanospirillum sediminis]MBB1489105.1 metal ABC transporter permease [Oceanospirillum sediminis]